MKLIIGLGNPGKQYEGTRHNIGFEAMDALRERLKLADFRNEAKFKAEVSRGEFNGDKVILAKPQTFMNLSGQAVLLLKQFYKVENEDLWLVYDDIDLPLGTLRMREGGSAGTHNGMKSVVQTLSTEDISRFRLGIESRGEMSPAQQDISSFVLESFRNEERFPVNDLLKSFSEAAVLGLKKDFSVAQDEFSQ
jgi:PTH1 family peptidyl-tRNA hydrolase